MHLLLLLVGVIGILGGLAGIGYGVVNPESRMVDTLAICGTVGLVGGFGLIGLGSLVFRLRRIAEALEMQPFPPRNLAVEARAPELHAGFPPAGNPFGPPPVPRAEEAPPKVVMPAPAEAPAIAPPPVPPPSPTSESTPKPGRFSTPLGEWPRLDPADRPAAAQNGGAAAEPASVPEAPPLPPVSPPGRDAPTASSSSSAEPAADTPRVLKSGVIEGMAYTLYSDGSVDAELPDGTLHFASISEWRAHLRVGA